MKKWLLLSILSAVLAFTIMPFSYVSADDGTVGTEQDIFPVEESIYNSNYKGKEGYELVRTEDQYFYYQRDKDYTTSGQPSLSGWTKCDTKTSESVSGYKFGDPIPTSEDYSGGKKTVKSAVNKGYYYYAYSVANPSKTSDWTYYVAKTQATVISHMKQYFSSSTAWEEKRLRFFWYISSSDLGSTTKEHLNKTIPYHKSSSVKPGITDQTGTHYYDLKLWKYKPCYKEKTVVTTNYFYKWQAWKAWSDDWVTERMSIPSDGTMKEETRKVYYLKTVRPTTPLSQCSVDITGPVSFKYDGEEKRLSIKLSHNGEELDPNTDYEIKGNAGIDAGKYKVSIIGQNDYDGVIDVEFTIEQTPAVLSFEKQSAVLKIGTTGFVNPLDAVTDGNITYSSSDENVATVDADGNVSVVGKGNARITASASEGKNYSAAEASYDITAATSLNDCALTVKESKFEYDGTEKSIQYVLEDENHVLVEGKDYTISGNRGVNSGTYTVILEGIGGYGDQREMKMDISKAPSKLSFDETTIIKRINDEHFQNKLSVISDGDVYYTSENENVATVDNDGNVTIKGEGTTAITATVQNGKNYKNASASYSLNVKSAVRLATLDDLRYNFENSWEDFGYKRPYYIASDLWRMMFGTVYGDTYFYTYKQGNGWGGNCAGISSTSALLFDSDNDINVSSFNQNAGRISALSLSDTRSDGLSLKRFIEAMQIGQKASVFQATLSDYKVYTGDHKNLNRLFETVKSQTDNGVPVLVAIGSGLYAHALLAYRVTVSGNQGTIFLYDSNDPFKERVINLKKDGDGNWTNDWFYIMGGKHGIWGSENGADNWISIVPYGIIQKVWNEKGEKLQKAYNTIHSSSNSIRVTDVDGHVVAQVEKGKMVKHSKDAILHQEDLALNPSKNAGITLSLPVGVYTIHNLDTSLKEIDVCVANSQVLSKTKTSAPEITAVAADEYGINNVFIDAGEADKYSVTLASSLPGDKKEVEVQGKGGGDVLEISQSGGAVNVENCQVLSMSVDGETPKTKTIRARRFGNGSISSSGKDEIVCGTDRKYEMKPDKGYQIQDVVVDDVSVGAVDSYTFKNVNEEHEIIVVFEPTSSYKKINNHITASNVTTVSSNKTKKIQLDISTEGKTKLIYKSDNRNIRISKDGILTISKNTIGKAKITITAAGNDYFNQAQKAMYVTVNPAASAVIKVKALTGKKVLVRWKKLGNVTGYEIQYSTSKKFGKAKTVKVKGKSKTTYRIKKLKAKKKYYVRVRAFKTTDQGTFVSKWSNVKSIKVRK